MPLTEKKGRFLIHTQCIPPDAQPASEKRFKKGRFTVTTCLPCVRPSRTHSAESEGTWLRGTLSSSHSASEDSLTGKSAQNDLRKKGKLPPHDSAHSSTRDSTPCKDQQFSESSSWDSSSSCSAHTQDSNASCDASSPAKPLRRVRFCEPDSSAALMQPVHSLPLAAAAQPSSIGPSNLPPQIRMHSDIVCVDAAPAASCSLSPTRSYCRGRFMVQEAVLHNSSLTRSASLPHCILEFLSHGNLKQGRSNPQQAVPLTPPQADAVPDSYWAATSAAPAGEVQGLLGTLSDSLHEYGTAAPVKRHPRPPGRSHSVSYFRRGRFLVQTVYT